MLLKNKKGIQSQLPASLSNERHGDNAATGKRLGSRAAS